MGGGILRKSQSHRLWRNKIVLLEVNPDVVVGCCFLSGRVLGIWVWLFLSWHVHCCVGVVTFCQAMCLSYGLDFAARNNNRALTYVSNS